MSEQVALIGLTRADPAIPWPSRGSGETALADRDGWERCLIPATIRGRPAEIEAARHGRLAVNVMVEGEGFAICLADTGYRLSYSGAVFGRCEDAMKAAEEMLAACPDWSNCQTWGFTDHQRDVLGSIVSGAEKRGEVLLDRVYPS